MKNLTLLISLLLATIAFADETNVTVLDAKKEIRTSSAQNRINKNVVTTGGIMAQGPAGVAGVGVNIGFYLTPDSLLQIELAGGETTEREDVTFLSTWEETTVKKGFSASFNFKHFTGNSFYFKTGANYRAFSFSEVEKDTPWDIYGGALPTTIISRSFKGESVAAGFTIGNQWQFDSFTLGCDWFGISVPVASRIYDEELSSNSSDSDRKHNREDKRLYVTGVGFTALNFYLGASF